MLINKNQLSETAVTLTTIFKFVCLVVTKKSEAFLKKILKNSFKMFRCTPLTLSLALGDYPTQFHRQNFHKSHQFEFVNNVPLLAEVNFDIKLIES